MADIATYSPEVGGETATTAEVNKVVANGKTLMDLTGDTVTAATLAKGVTAHDKSGAPITGTLDTTAVAQATPTITVSSSGKITATSTQAAGTVAAGTKTATKQLTTQAGKTVTPGTATQTAVSSGRYTTGPINVKGDSNLKAGNIKSGVSIFGVAGTYSASGGGGGVDVKYLETVISAVDWSEWPYGDGYYQTIDLGPDGMPDAMSRAQAPVDIDLEILDLDEDMIERNFNASYVKAYNDEWALVSIRHVFDTYLQLYCAGSKPDDDIPIIIRYFL